MVFPQNVVRTSANNHTIRFFGHFADNLALLLIKQPALLKHRAGKRVKRSAYMNGK